jgi:CDP-glucose 4,6-dehydratase
MRFDGSVFANKRVLITGHTGFKGSWLTKLFLSFGADVIGFSLMEPVSTPNLFDEAGLSAHIDDIRGDIRDLTLLKDTVLLARPDVIFHLAAQPIVQRSYRAPQETFAVNTLGTANILEAARFTPSVRAVVVVTSDKCYRYDGKGIPFRENDPLGGEDPYSASKAAAELVTAAYRSILGFPAVASARSGNVVGGGDWGEDRLIPDLARAAAAGGRAAIRNPEHTRPWHHVAECVYAYALLGARLLEGESAAESAFNFGPDVRESHTVSEVVAIAERSWAVNQLSEDRARTGDGSEAPTLLLDSARANTVLGWAPAVGFEETVNRAMTWYKKFYDGSAASALMDEDVAFWAEQLN